MAASRPKAKQFRDLRTDAVFSDLDRAEHGAG